MPKFIYPEGTTPIDADEAQGLLLTHITTRVELDRWEEENILEALKWLRRTKPTRVLNEPFIKELHRHMFDNVWTWAGHFRKSDKNIGGSWRQISMDLKKLCDDIHFAIELQKEPFDHVAVRFHHRMVLIHAFPNGNGRHARLMTDTILENIMHRPKFTWGRKGLAKPGTQPANVRKKYIAALQAADEHDYGPLQQFVRT